MQRLACEKSASDPYWQLANTNTGLGVVLKFWNLSLNVLKFELGPEICTYILKFSRVFTIFLKTHIILLILLMSK